MATAIQRLGLGFLLLSLLCCAEAAAKAKANAKNGQSLMTWLRSMRTKRQESSLTSDRMWTLADAIPGEPDRDYPILSEIPETDFSCDGRKEGYYADIGARCQVFRICANTANNTAKGFSFLCPNGTLFNQEYFVCDWYMNVNCENSENFYNLNDLIGKTMGDSSKKELMNSARELIMFPQTPNGKGKGGGGGGDIFDNYPSQLGSPLGISGGGPARGSLNLGQPTSAVGNFPNGGGPQRGGNGGTVYPDADSNLDLDVRNTFDTLKGIGNSYSFGFPGDGAPTRGSEDLSEPVDPAAFLANQQYLPPFAGGPNRQIYTYPQDAQSLGPNNIQAILPEYTGQLNTKISAQSPKYPTAQVYGPPAVAQPAGQPAGQNRFQPQSGNQARPQSASQTRYQQPSNQPASNQQRPQQQANNQQANNQQRPQQQQQQQQQQPQQQQQQQQQQKQAQKLYQQPHQTQGAQTRHQNGGNGNNNNQPANNYQQSQPVRLYQQPQNQRSQQSFSQQPQPFRPQSQQIERRQFNVPQSNGNQNHNRNGGGGGGGGSGNGPKQQQANGNRGSGGNGQKQTNGNEDYLRNFLKDKTHIHHDKVGLVELIQRLFHPASSQQRVVSADVIPSPARESYSFTYDGQGSVTNSNHHKHTGTCGHQGY